MKFLLYLAPLLDFKNSVSYILLKKGIKKNHYWKSSGHGNVFLPSQSQFRVLYLFDQKPRLLIFSSCSRGIVSRSQTLEATDREWLLFKRGFINDVTCSVSSSIQPFLFCWKCLQIILLFPPFLHSLFILYTKLPCSAFNELSRMC